MASTSRISVHSTADVAGALRGSVTPEGLLLTEEDLGPDFYELKTGLAGELFQKVVNYRGRLAIVIRDARVYGERFSELAYEHRRHPSVRVFDDRAQALQWLQAARDQRQEHERS
jgi:hypothetical protein